MKASNIQIWVNDKGPFVGSLQIDTEMIDVTSNRDSHKPDPKWEYVDKAGHWHAFTSDGKHPTLERYEKQVPCDGSCGGICEGEGTTETRYRCRSCGKRVKPNFVVDVPAFTPQRTAGRQEWAVRVATGRTSLNAAAAPVSVRVVTPGRLLFGLASLLDVAIQSDGSGTQWDYQLAGITELGVRS